MKPDDQHLRETLAKLSTPPPSELAQAQASAKALETWRESHRPESTGDNRSRPAQTGWIWAMTAVAAVLVLLLVLLAGRNASPIPVPENAKEPLSAVAKAPAYVLAEMEKLFPGRVLAVVEQDQAVDLQLDDAPTPVPTEQALQIELVRGSQRVEVLTYSGRSFSVKLNGHPTQVMPLLTGAGALIMVTGDQMISGHGQIDGYEVAGHRIIDNKS